MRAFTADARGRRDRARDRQVPGVRLKLAEWGLEDHAEEISCKAAQIARKAAGSTRFVAGSIGPTGFLPASDDPTLGQILFKDLVEVFTEQARA